MRKSCLLTVATSLLTLSSYEVIAHPFSLNIPLICSSVVQRFHQYVHHETYMKRIVFILEIKHAVTAACSHNEPLTNQRIITIKSIAIDIIRIYHDFVEMIKSVPRVKASHHEVPPGDASDPRYRFVYIFLNLILDYFERQRLNYSKMPEYFSEDFLWNT